MILNKHASMPRNVLGMIGKGGAGLLKALTVGLTIIVRVATSDEVKYGLTVAASGLASLIIFGVKGTGSLIGKASPGLRKIWRVGIVGGTRQFIGQFNNNGGASIQSTRNTLKPVGYASVVSSVLLMFAAPLAGVGLFLGTFIVFFRPVEKLSLDSFLADFGVESAVGVGTALVLNLFRAFGALRAAWRWVWSQFNS